MFNSATQRDPAYPTHTKTEIASVNGTRLAVHPTVFHPKFFPSSAFLAKHLRSLDLMGKHVLDCGTGTGILGIVAAKRGATVTAVDINDLALDAARENAERNQVSMRILKSDWFSAVQDERFDMIVANPPYISKPHGKQYGAAWYAGEEHEHVLGLIEGCDEHLAPGGEALIVLSSHADIEWWLREFGTEGLRGERVAHKRRMTEELMIFRFTA